MHVLSVSSREYSIVRGKVVTSRFAQASFSCTVTIMSNTRVVERSHSACASFACFAVVPPRTGLLSPHSYEVYLLKNAKHLLIPSFNVEILRFIAF